MAALGALPAVGQVFVDIAVIVQVLILSPKALGVHNLPANATLHQGCLIHVPILPSLAAHLIADHAGGRVRKNRLKFKTGKIYQLTWGCSSMANITLTVEMM